MRRRLQMLVDRGITLPLIDQPVTDAELKAQFLHIPIIGIEMLMMHHARRAMHGIALIPVVAPAADFRIAVTFQSIQIGLGVRMAVTFGMRQIDKYRADRDSGGLEPVLFSAPPHQEIRRAVLRLVRFFLLALMHRNTASVFRPILRFLLGKARENLGIVLTALFELL